MAAAYIHYLFGELQQVNESRVVPSTAAVLKSWLDTWLPQWLQSAEEAEPRYEQVRARCREWQTGDWREEVGVISLPLADAPEFAIPEFGALRFTHLICRVYFNWASAGRVSCTGHAVLLSANQWQALDFNPFRLPHLVKNSGEFASSVPLNFEAFESQTHTPTDWGNAQRVAPWRSHLAAIWHGTPPVRLPADAPPWLYELLLMSLPRARRASASCVCGPFGLKRSFQQLIDFAPDFAPDSAPDSAPGASPGLVDLPANASACIQMLDKCAPLEGCWQASWVPLPLGVPGLVAPTRSALRPLPAGPVSMSASPSVTINREGRRKGVGLPLWLGIGVVLLGAGIYWGTLSWQRWRIEQRCAAWVQDVESEKRSSETQALLARAELLLNEDPDRQICPELTGVSALIGLYQYRLAAIESRPFAELDVGAINRLNADLIALAALPLVLASDSAPKTSLLTASDRLYRLAQQWVSERGTAKEVHARYQLLKKDMAEKGLASNPYFADIETRLRALQQQEAINALRLAANRIVTLDLAGLEIARKLAEDFRRQYSNAREAEIADILADAALRYENGANSALLAALANFQRDPMAEHLSALESALTAYLLDIAPARALAEQVDESAALLERLKSDRIVHISVLQAGAGEVVEIARLDDTGRCMPQQSFQLFANEKICISVIQMDTPILKQGERAAEASWLNALPDLLASLRAWIPTAKLYTVNLQELVLAPTWQSPDGRVRLRSEIDWSAINRLELQTVPNGDLPRQFPPPVSHSQPLGTL
jgi:hypothetical protein